MLTIHKYLLDDYNCWVEAPIVKWLKVDYQNREQTYVAWALVDLEAPKRKFQFLGFETGSYVPSTMFDEFEYLDSVNLDYYVLHWFVAESNPVNDGEAADA